MCLSSREACHERLMSSLESDAAETETDPTRPSFKDIFGVTESAVGTKSSSAAAPPATTTIRAPTVKTTVTRRPVTSSSTATSMTGSTSLDLETVTTTTVLPASGAEVTEVTTGLMSSAETTTVSYSEEELETGQDRIPIDHWRSTFHRCQCCEDNPPARCERLREQIPCGNAQFRALCSNYNVKELGEGAEEPAIPQLPSMQRPIPIEDEPISTTISPSESTTTQGSSTVTTTISYTEEDLETVQDQIPNDKQVSFHRCQCCGANPPARCDRLREQIPCDNAQFQALCSNYNKELSSGDAEESPISRLPSVQSPIPTGDKSISTTESTATQESLFTTRFPDSEVSTSSQRTTISSTTSILITAETTSSAAEQMTESSEIDEEDRSDVTEAAPVGPETATRPETQGTSKALEAERDALGVTEPTVSSLGAEGTPTPSDPKTGFKDIFEITEPAEDKLPSTSRPAEPIPVGAETETQPGFRDIFDVADSLESDQFTTSAPSEARTQPGFKDIFEITEPAVVALGDPKITTSTITTKDDRTPTGTAESTSTERIQSPTENGFRDIFGVTEAVESGQAKTESVTSPEFKDIFGLAESSSESATEEATTTTTTLTATSNLKPAEDKLPSTSQPAEPIPVGSETETQPGFSTGEANESTSLPSTSPTSTTTEKAAAASAKLDISFYNSTARTSFRLAVCLEGIRCEADDRRCKTVHDKCNEGINVTDVPFAVRTKLSECQGRNTFAISVEFRVNPSILSN